MYIDWIYILEGIPRNKKQGLVKFIKKWFKVNLPSIWRTNSKLAKMTGIHPKWIDCCINSCLAYTGDFKDDKICLQKLKANNQICNEPRFHE